MTDPIRDPVNRVRYAFEPHGENLVVDVWREPGGQLPAHLHPRQTERWTVLDAAVDFQLGDEKRIVGPGTVHALAAVGDGEAHLRCVADPALHLQSFLEESAAAARAGLFTRRSLPRGLRGARWAARFLKRHRDETVFLSPPLLVQRALVALLAR